MIYDLFYRKEDHIKDSSHLGAALTVYTEYIQTPFSRLGREFC